MSDIGAVANFVAARSNIEVGQAVATSVIQAEQAVAANLIETLEENQALIEVAQANITPTLDGTGGSVDRSV